ncbi:unnamed protein product, partial [Prorocentrum cordatum]
VLVRYDDDLLHARMLLAAAGDTRWVIYTPDGDLYEEEYGPNNGDVTGVRAFRLDGSIPASQQGASVYNFRAGGKPAGAVLQGLKEEAPESWLFVERNAITAVGDECVGGPEATLRKLGFARVGADILSVEQVLRYEVERWRRSHAETSDARVLPVTYTPVGERNRPWSSVAESINESAIDSCPVKGPRTAMRVALFLARRNTGPEDHHRWWKATARLNASDWGVAEHSQLCSCLEAAGSVD